MEIHNTYLVRIWYVLTLVRTKYVFASLNTPFGTYLVRICFSKYVLRTVRLGKTKVVYLMYLYRCEDRRIKRSNHAHAIVTLCGYCMGQSVSS